MNGLHLKATLLKGALRVWAPSWAAGLRGQQPRTLGTVEVGLALLLAGAPRRVAQAPLALGNEVQDRLVIRVHDQALLG